MYIIRILDNETTIDLGRRGENRALAIDFPIDNFIANYGAGMASLAYIRPGDTEPYICRTETVVNDGATYLRWVVTDTDTAKAGSGRCELRWNVDDTGDGDTIDDYDTRAKSIIYTTTVHPSLTDETEIPDPYKDWYDAMMAALAPAIDAADSPALQLLNGGTKIPIGTTKDLNNFLYITEGVYYSDGTVELTNCPVTTPFVMLVREQQAATSSAEGYTSYLITRILITAGGTPKIWVQGGELFRPFTRPTIFGSWTKMPGANNLGYITNLSDVPIGSNGYVRFNAAISPTGALDNFSYWCTGTDNRRSIIAVYNNDTTAKVFVNVMYDPAQTEWKGWEQLPIGLDPAAVTANTAGRLGMLAAGTNIDDLHENSNCGTYWLICLDTAVTGTLPASTGHGLLIINRQDSTYTRQTYIPVTNVDGAQSAVRWYSNSSKSWSAWSPTWIQSKVNELNSKVGFSIMGLTNLDAIPINGMGYVQTANDADFVPVSGVIAYNVVAFGYSNAQRTLVFSRTGNNTMYVNTKSSASAWSGWKSITMS